MGRRLFFLHVTGCEACEDAERHLGSFESAHSDVEVVRVDLADEEWPSTAPLEPPDYTPAYVSLATGLRPRTIQGRILTADELDRWVYARG